MRVKPATEELKVRDPERGGHLPTDGAEVPDTEYWRRRLADAAGPACQPAPRPADAARAAAS